MSAYVIYHYNIVDRNGIEELTKQSASINEYFGAEVIVGSPVKAFEGETYTHMVILKRRDFDAAKNYYESDEHKELSLLRNKITQGWSTIIPGVSETQQLVDSGYFDCA